MTPDTARLRLSIIGIVVLSLFAALLARLWYLQVMASPTYEVQATTNRVRLVQTEAPRGRILDRNGNLLVDNRVVDAITVNREELAKNPDVFGRLAFVLGRPVEDLQKRATSQKASVYKPVPVAEDVPEEVLLYVSEHESDFPGVKYERVTERAYPNGRLAAHLLGSVGEVNKEELAPRKAKGYRQGDTIGKSGVEAAFEEDLRGKPGVEKLEVDAKGRSLRVLDKQEPVRGHDVWLTVDINAQRLAEESLALGLEAAHGAYDRQQLKYFIAPGGAAVVLDPRDGSVLAMASLPNFEPADFVGGIPDDTFAGYNGDPGAPLTNRAIQGLYPPGSTFKLFTSVAAMKGGLIDSRTSINDPGFIRIGNQEFNNAGRQRNGPVNLSRALTVSSDVFYYTLGNDFWAQRNVYGDTVIQDTARAMGLGQRTGVSLAFEAPGRVPDPSTRKKLHEQSPAAFPEARWFPGDNAQVAIGQAEMAITPLQLALGYATFANGGTVWQPRLGDSVRLPDGDRPKVRDVAPHQARSIDLAPEVRDPILQGLKGAVADPRGTAAGAFAGFPDDISVAGKTGTAQVGGEKQDTALFTCFAPADDPQFTITVILEEAGFGAEAAAPVARRILDGVMGLPVSPGVARAAAPADR